MSDVTDPPEDRPALILRIRARITKASTEQLTVDLVIGGTLIVVIWAWLRTRPLFSASPYVSVVDSSVIFIMFTFLGWAGVVAMLRREFPQFHAIKGKGTFILGAVMAVVFWGVGTWALITGAVKFYELVMAGW